ncbi:MAG: hypothetical protein NC115_04590 [Bacteroidales bacterium]|nr:hypothetical protein [Bacteroidales bacterium]
MKKTLLMIAAFSALMLAGCKKPAETEEPIKVSLEVTEIQDNCATVKVQLTSGKFYGAKLVEMVNVDDVTVDYTSDIQLVNYVQANGTDIELPYENTLTGVKIGQDKLTAIIVFDNTGRASVAEKVVWTPAGLPAGWSTENNPGELTEIIW